MSAQTWIFKGYKIEIEGPTYTELSVVACTSAEARREFRALYPEVKLLGLEIVGAWL